jgi:hypothetical protein
VEPVRKILLMLIVRMREAARVSKLGQAVPMHCFRFQRPYFSRARCRRALIPCRLALIESSSLICASIVVGWPFLRFLRATASRLRSPDVSRRL